TRTPWLASWLEEPFGPWMGNSFKGHIDFGLASPRLLVEGRVQLLGVADHDLVTYQLRAYLEEDTRRWQPQRRLVAKEPADWEAGWADFAAGFDEAVEPLDLDRAWQLLSQAAENAMAEEHARPARPRALPGRPVIQERRQTRAKELQTLLERRLRRVARRASEAARNGDAKLRAKLDRDLDELETCRGLTALTTWWKHDIQDDVGAMARWITAQVTNEVCKAAGFGTERLRGFLDSLGPASPAAVREVHFDGHLLRRRARRAKRKAGGLDGWTGELVAALPLDFFDKLARLWTAVVKGGKAALAVLRWWGAPEWLASVLEDFYAGQERWVAVAGVFASSPVGAGASLLQGCPFSPLLLNAMMGVWSRYVQTQVDNLGVGIYLDDRSLWTRGRGAVQRLEAAARAGAWADSMLGFELHPNKLESFACNGEQREALMEYADVIGIPQCCLASRTGSRGTRLSTPRT
ncbi:Cacna1c, partial [Symbiodinium pilosum]